MVHHHYTNMYKHPEILAKGKPLYTPLFQHLKDVKDISLKFGSEFNIDENILYWGSILHDIGKTSPIFQYRISDEYIRNFNDLPFRHEIASVFFISLFNKNIQDDLIEMIIGHHKSVKFDNKEMGLIDLVKEYDIDNVFNFHIKYFNDWKEKAINILNYFGLNTDKKLTIDDAKNNFIYAYNKTKELIKEKKYSKLKGVLIGSDYLASALPYNVNEYSKKLFKRPNFNFYNNLISEQYPLSLKPVKSSKPHSMVVACTGAGKTNYLLRRCKNRVFYVLPYTASINAMYNRIKKDISKDNYDLDIRVQHSTSQITVKNESYHIQKIQSHIGSSIKVLTPHQIMGCVFGINGYESTLLDLSGNDVIFDEIHTYSDKLQGIIIKMVEILKNINCKIHVGTATLPSILYNRILKVLGENNVLQTKLNDEELETYNRHIIHKRDTWDDVESKIDEAIEINEKVLLIKNNVRESQEIYLYYKEKYKNVDVLLLHSRFKRGRRNELENILMEYNESNKPCIVISTQVVEVSLDISFDLMITENAPIDSLIQRFGRINRKRKSKREYKDVYIINHEKKATILPYKKEILDKTYNTLPNDVVFEEKNVQKYIDNVYDNIDIQEIENASIFKNGYFTQKNLVVKNKSIIFEELNIEGCIIIIDTDLYDYENSKTYNEKLKYEIPCSYQSLRWLNLIPRKINNKQIYVLDENFYDNELGLILNNNYFNNNSNFL